MMPLCMVISWVYSVAMTIQHIVAEKEHRLKEVGRWAVGRDGREGGAWVETGESRRGGQVGGSGGQPALPWPSALPPSCR